MLKNSSCIDANGQKYIQNLKEAVAIPSVSALADKRKDVRRMSEWTADRLKKLGVEVSLRELGEQILPNGDKLPLPPVVFGQLGKDPKKKTVLLYGHLDVQPANKEDGEIYKDNMHELYCFQAS